MLGNEPLSKWSLETNSQRKLWGDMLMKCQSCHFICSNYRLACRPFNDHLQHSLQCIRDSTKSLPLWLSLYLRTHTCLHYYQHTLPPHIFHCTPPIRALFICKAQNKTTHWAAFSWPVNQKLSRTFVITIVLYLSIKTEHILKRFISSLPLLSKPFQV